MYYIRHTDERGSTDVGGLCSRHTFSFGQYYDPIHIGFGPLRVINEDFVQPGGGFETHGHSDMEIISYVLSGSLEHKDSMGNGSIIKPGEVQRMTAGTGVLHSEFNSSATEGLHFLQIWILPDQLGLEPGYEHRTFAETTKRGALCLVGSRYGRNGSLTIHQDVDLYATCLCDGEDVTYSPEAGRRLWVQIVRGVAEVNGVPFQAGDGIAMADKPHVMLRGMADAEILLLDMSA
jgi:hypothetical protein